MKVTGVILAGGRGARMGGADKGLVMHAGRPLIEWVIDRIRPQVDELLINANRNLDDYGRYGYRVVTDLNDDFAGPLAGMQAGLNTASHEYVLCVPCDTPALPADLAMRLVKSMEQFGCDVAVAATAEGWQPTVCLLRRELASNLATTIIGGQLRVRDWIEACSHVAVPFTDQSAFANLNTPDSL